MILGIFGLKLIGNSLRSSKKLLRLYILVEILFGISWITGIVVCTLLMTRNFLVDFLVSFSIGVIHSLFMIKYYKYINRTKLLMKSLLQELSEDVTILDFSTTYSIIYYHLLIKKYGKK